MLHRTILQQFFNIYFDRGLTVLIDEYDSNFLHVVSENNKDVDK